MEDKDIDADTETQTQTQRHRHRHRHRHRDTDTDTGTGTGAGTAPGTEGPTCLPAQVRAGGGRGRRRRRVPIAHSLPASVAIGHTNGRCSAYSSAAMRAAVAPSEAVALAVRACALPAVAGALLERRSVRRSAVSLAVDAPPWRGVVMNPKSHGRHNAIGPSP